VSFEHLDLASADFWELRVSEIQDRLKAARVREAREMARMCQAMGARINGRPVTAEALLRDPEEEEESEHTPGAFLDLWRAYGGKDEWIGGH